jgi:glucose-6-phosphate isomerase
MLQLKTEQGGTELETKLGQLGAYTERLVSIRKSGTYEEYESSINLSSDQALIEQAKTLATEKATAKLKYNIVVGIGGSNLGTKAVYDALFGYRDVMDAGRDNRSRMVKARWQVT